MKNIKLLPLLLCVCLLATACAHPTPEQTFTVTVAVDGTETRNEYRLGEEISLPDANKNGYVFLGYYDGDGNKVTFPYTVTSDVTLTAKFEYDATAYELLQAVSTYVNSETFAKSVANAKTAAAWLPLAYLRYVKGNFYTADNAAVFKGYLDMIDELLTDGEIKDINWYNSAAQKQGWYGILDYLYSYSIAANAYKEFLYANGLPYDGSDKYNDAIAKYLEKIDEWEANATKKKYTVGGKEVSQINLNAEGYFYYSHYSEMTLSYVTELLGAVAEATGTAEGHEEFISDYRLLQPKYDAIEDEKQRIAPQLEPLNEQYDQLNQKYNDLTKQWREAADEEKDALKAQADQAKAERDEVNNQRNQLKQHQTELEKEFREFYESKDFLKRFRSFLPVTTVSFGMTAYSYLAIVKANLGLNADLPYTDKTILNYYQKDENGEFTRAGGTPNWVGPSGRPIAASLYRNCDGYDVNFEKYRQGYFPFTDGFNQPLEEMITLDTLGKYYNHELTTGANVMPQWGLLTGYMHGIDMQNYEVAKPVQGEPTSYNIISLWQNNLSQKEGVCVIENNVDLAVAVAYLAFINGVDAPTPLGVFDASAKVIEL